MNIQEVKNETLAKLTAEEIGQFGLLNYGVMTYKGTLKKRRNGWKTEAVGERQVNFVHETLPFRYEFIKIQKTMEEDSWAMRIYDTELKSYSVHVQPLAGVDFLK